MEEMNEDWENCCPLCMEEMDSTDRQLKPCRCGYQICVWCWNHIMEMAEKDSTEGRCPACRTPYDKEKIVSAAVSCDRLGEINDKKQKPGKSKTKASEGRKNLSNVRVIQRNLVYVVGIPAALADEETLERKEYFGQYGKILKISVSKTGGQHSSAGSSVSVYVTYVKEEDAMRCIQSVHGYTLDGKVLKACFGTTKYCNAWLKHMPCNNPDCLYLHDEGTREDSFTKEEMLAKYGSKNQHFHELTHPQRRSGIGLPPPADAPPFTSGSNASQNAATLVGSAPKAVPLVASLPKSSSSLPAAASWGSRSSSRPTSGRNNAVSTTGKLKTGAGLINLATVSGTCTSGVSVNNYDGVKHLKASNADGAQTSLAGPSRLLERPHSATETSARIQAQALHSNADNVTADVDVSRPAFDGLISHRRNLSGSEAKDHAYGVSKEIRTVDSSSSHKFVDAEDSGMTTDVLAGKGVTRTATTRDTGIKNLESVSTPMPVDSTFLDHNDTRIHKDPSIKSRGSLQFSNLDCRTDLASCAQPDQPSRKLESGSQQATFEVHSISDKSYGSENSNDTFSLPLSNTSSLNVLSRSDHTVSSSLNHASDDYEDICCNIPSGNPWSSSIHPVNNSEQSVYSRGETALQPEDSILAEKNVGKCKADENGKSRTAEPLNGLSEHELISDMFSTGFDLWTDGSPQVLAQLLFNKKKSGSSTTSAPIETTTTWKPSSGSKQSRFHFARQDELNEQTLCSSKVALQTGIDRQMRTEKHGRNANGNVPVGLSEVAAGDQFLSKLPASVDHYGGSPSSHLMNSKSPMMAPPGFSSVRASAVPPPGFSQHKPTDIRRLPEAPHEPSRSLAHSNSYNHLEAANSSADVEFIDPAIMAVGKGKLPTGSRTTVPFASSPSLSAFLSQTAPLSQQPRPQHDFETGYQTHQEHPYRSFGSTSQTSHLGYSSQDLDTSSSSLFHSSFNDTISQPRLMGQYHDTILPHAMMQESVYGNGGHGAPKLRFQHSSSDDWSKLSELNTTGQPSVSDTVGRLAMSQISLDRVLQNRLEGLTLTKDLSSKYYGDAAIPTGYDEQGALSSGRLGRYFLQN